MTETEGKKRYISARGLFALSFPNAWRVISEKDGIVSLTSPTGGEAVTVSAAARWSEAARADACEQLQRHVAKLGIEADKFRKIECTRDLAVGEYVNESQVYWRFEFKASHNVVVFATYNRALSDGPRDEHEAALAILSSVTIQPKR